MLRLRLSSSCPGRDIGRRDFSISVDHWQLSLHHAKLGSLCVMSLNDVRQVICGRPLVLWPDSGIQVMATCAGLTSGNRSSSNIYCLRIEILAERIVDHELNEYYNLIAQMLD